MKFTVEQSDLLKALNALSLINTKIIKDSVINNVKITKLSDNKIRLVATDMTTALQYDVPASDIEGEGILYNLTFLMSLVSRLSGIIKFDNGNIKANKSKYKVPMSGIELYPDVEFNHSEGLEFENLTNALQRTMYAAQKAQGTLSGVNFANDEIVATDGNRLVITKLQNNLEDKSFILSKESCFNISKIFEDEKLYIDVTDRNSVFVYNDDIVLKTTLLVGQFPKYQTLLPKEHKYTIQFNRDEMFKALNMLIPVMNLGNMVCKFTILDNNLNIQCNNADSIGDVDIAITSNVSEELIVGFNAQFLLDMLKNYGKEVELQCNSELSPAVFVDSNNYTLIMPIKLANTK